MDFGVNNVQTFVFTVPSGSGCSSGELPDQWSNLLQTVIQRHPYVTNYFIKVPLRL